MPAEMHLIHDLKMALLVLGHGLETLRASLQSESQQREAAALDRLLHAGLAMADELLVNSELKPPIAPVDVNAVIVGACDVIQAIVGPDVRVDALLMQGESRIYARQVDLDRILLNLVTNAAAAMPSGGVLVIETAYIAPAPDYAKRYPDAPFGQLRLTIGDTGRGVTMRDVWQVRDSTQLPRPDGSGIGLSSVSLIVLRLGGRLEIAPGKGVGTVVAITLPLAPPERERVH